MLNEHSTEPPVDESGYQEIEQSRMYLGQQAMSEAQEEAISVLSPEQLKILQSAKLEIGEAIQNNIRITGEVVIEGQTVSLEVYKHKEVVNENGGWIQRLAYFARLDGQTIEDQNQAQQLFDFYFPIAKAITQNKYYPTKESDKKYTKKLIDKLLGK